MKKNQEKEEEVVGGGGEGGGEKRLRSAPAFQGKLAEEGAGGATAPLSSRGAKLRRALATHDARRT